MAGGTSTLLLQEYFDSASESFLKELLGSNSGPALKALASKWLKDERPFAREMLLRYLDDGCDRPGHRPLVKALFKAFEQRKDEAADEVMAHFLVAFDRMPRRRVVRRHRWDPQQQGMVEYGELVPDPSIVPRDYQGEAVAAAYRQSKPLKPGFWPHAQFSRKTRQYLKRRAFRYFRQFGGRDPERYRRAILKALNLYEDVHLQKAAQFLDAWSLVHVLYWGSPVLHRHAWRGVEVAEGQALSNLKPAPLFKHIWKDCRDELIELLATARSRTVRVWTSEWLKSEYGAQLQGLPVTKLKQMLASPHEEAQLFAAEMLKTASGLEALPITEWMELLRIENPTVIPLVCQLVEKNVTPNRLTLAQCVELACGPMAPVGELGFKWARAKPVRGAIDLGVLMQLGNARTATVRAQASAWLGELLSTSENARDEHLRELIDSRYEDIRVPALGLFTKAPRFKESLALWGAIAESPYDDARGVLVKHLGEREKTLEPDALRHVWVTTLLAVHRGGRAKQIVLNRVANRVANRPSEADNLLPLLGIALRSVRDSERRGALAAIASAAARTPSLKAAISNKLPGLVLHEGVPV